MDTTSYLALSRQVALQRHMDRSPTTSPTRPPRLSRRAHCVRAACCSGAGRGRGSPSSRTWRWRAICARADRADRQSARPGARRRRLFRFATAGGTRYGRGRPARAGYGRAAGERGGRSACSTTAATPITLPADERPISIAADGTMSGAHGRDRPHRHRRASPTSRPCAQVGDGLLPAERGARAGRPARAWSRARSKAPTCSRSSR